jgi:hypothetical protein
MFGAAVWMGLMAWRPPPRAPAAAAAAVGDRSGAHCGRGLRKTRQAGCRQSRALPDPCNRSRANRHVAL